MPYRDLRDFITALERNNELKTVKGADWDLEIGTIDELNYEKLGPAFLFDRIKDYPEGYRILTNAMDSMRRALLAIDFPLDLDVDTAVQRFDERVYSTYKPVPPVDVGTGPVLENTLRGDAIDLWKVPVPRTLYRRPPPRRRCRRRRRPPVGRPRAPPVRRSPV